MNASVGAAPDQQLVDVSVHPSQLLTVEVLRRPLDSAFAAPVGVEDHAGDVTAAHGDGHLQRAGGELGVVMLGQAEADDPPRGQVLDGGQVELAFVGGHLGEIAAPLMVDRRRREVPFDQVRGRWGGLVGTGQKPRRVLVGRATSPWRAIDASTLFFDTRHPSCDEVGEHPRRPIAAIGVIEGPLHRRHPGRRAVADAASALGCATCRTTTR